MNCYQPVLSFSKLSYSKVVSRVRSFALASVGCLSLLAPNYVAAEDLVGLGHNEGVVRIVGCGGEILAEYSGVGGLSGPRGVSLELKGVDSIEIGNASPLVLRSVNSLGKTYSADLSGNSTVRFGPFDGAGTWEFCPNGQVDFSEVGFVTGDGSSNSGSVVLASLAGVGGIVAIGGERGGSSGSLESSGVGSGGSAGAPVAAVPNTGSDTERPSSSGDPSNGHSNGGGDVPRCASVDCGLDEDPTPLSPIS